MIILEIDINVTNHSSYYEDNIREGGKEEIEMTKNKKQTSKDVASNASKILSDPNSSKTAKSLAASALSQFKTKNQTGAEIEELASTVLRSPKYSDETKELAGSVLTQSNKER